MSQLKPGDTFPELTLVTVAGEIVLPQALAGDFSVVLFNRGHWCPYCVAQLRSFQRALPKLTEAAVKIAAIWVDDRATTKE